MDGRPTRTDCDKAGDYVVPNVLSPRDLVFRPDNMDKTVPHTKHRREKTVFIMKTCPCNVHYLTPYFYIVKLGFTGVNIFSYFCSKTKIVGTR